MARLPICTVYPRFRVTVRFHSIGFHRTRTSCTKWNSTMKTISLPASDRHALETASASAPPIDSEVLFARCMGNVSFALALLGELEASGKQQVDAIVLHATSDEPHAVAEAAHALKGAAAIIGAESLRGKAAEIEAAGHEGDTSLLLEIVHDLRGEMDRCLTYIPILRADLQRLSSPSR